MKKKFLFYAIFFGMFLVNCSGYNSPTNAQLQQSQQITVETPHETAVQVTPTITDTKTITPRPSQTYTITPTPIHPTSTIVFHEADQEIIYNWFSYIPHNLSKNKPVYILLTGLNGGIYDYEESTRTAKLMLEERLRWPNINQFVLLVPVIPRRENPHVYPVAFDLANFKEKDDFFNRADLKINSMVDRLTSDLIKDGYQISSKLMIEGYSSGGMFAQRYSLLHPERVKAIAGGQCGGNFTLPIDQFEEQPTNWPVGVNNITELTGIIFDKYSYGNIHQFIYIGDLDTGEGGTTIVWNRLHPTWGPQYMWESVDQMEFLNNEFGESDPTRLKKQIEYLNSIGFSKIEFRLYPGAHHEMTRQMINDFMNFLVEQTKE